MGAAGNIQGVFPGFQLVAIEAIAVGIPVIIAGRIIGRERNGHRVLLARLQQLGLGIAYQHLMGFFNAACGVRRGSVQLHHVFPGGAAGVPHGDGHGHDGICVKGSGGGLAHFPIERSIGKAVAEGEHHVGFIPILAVGIAAGFIVPIAHVDAFFVVHGVIHAQIVLVCGLVSMTGAEILEGGIPAEIRCPGVHQAAGGIHCAVQYFPQGGDAVGAGEANPHSRVNFIRKSRVSRVGQEGSFKAGRNIEQHDHMFKTRTAHSGKKVTLVLIELQVVAVGADRAFGGALVAGQVKAFAADAGNHHQCRVVIGSVAVLHLVGILALGCFRRGDTLVAAAVQVAGVGGAGRAGLAVVLVESLQGGVRYEASTCQAGVQFLIVAGIKAAGAGAAVA